MYPPVKERDLFPDCMTPTSALSVTLLGTKALTHVRLTKNAAVVMPSSTRKEDHQFAPATPPNETEGLNTQVNKLTLHLGFQRNLSHSGVV